MNKLTLMTCVCMCDGELNVVQDYQCMTYIFGNDNYLYIRSTHSYMIFNDDDDRFVQRISQEKKTQT